MSQLTYLSVVATKQVRESTRPCKTVRSLAEFGRRRV